MAALRPLGPNAATHRLDECSAGYFLGERSPPELSFASQAELVMAMPTAPTSVIAGDDVGVCAVFWVGEGDASGGSHEASVN